MRTPRQIRRLPWVAFILLAFTVGACFYLLRSRTHCERLNCGRFGFFLDYGVAGFAAYTDDPGNRPTREHWLHNPAWFWHWFNWGRTENTSFSAACSAWPIPLITGAVGFGFATRWLRRLRSAGCLKCGYDLKALSPADPCPECGLAQVTTTRNSV